MPYGTEDHGAPDSLRSRLDESPSITDSATPPRISSGSRLPVSQFAKHRERRDPWEFHESGSARRPISHPKWHSAMNSVHTDVGVAEDSAAATLFASSAQLTLLDHFRIPYEVNNGMASGALHQLRASPDGPTLLWPAALDDQAVAAVVPGSEHEKQVPVFARLLGDDVAERLIEARGPSWRRVRSLVGDNGNRLAAIWRSDDGSIFVPFDPNEVILNYWSEQYQVIATGGAARRVRRSLMRIYYHLRRLMPRRLQIWLRRRFVRVQARSRFPRWPVETSLHDFFELMFGLLASIAGEPVPVIAPWPNGYGWALVLTHDVEFAAGWAAVDPVLDLERSHRMRSSWNLVDRRDYEVSAARVEELAADGFEVGVHGLYHDGRDFASLTTFQARLPAMQDAARRWGAVGFRAPAMHRQWEWMPLLGLDYDSSYPDTDPFEPQPGGCCTWLPFFNNGIVELPVTLAQDHTLFAILRRDGTVWADKARFLRSRGGLALIITHPDYLLDDRILAAYRHFLDEFASDATVWKALPSEVSSWWRRRATSSLARAGERWEIAGPASNEGRIQFVGSSRPFGDL